MFRKMRRKKQELSEQRTADIMRRGKSGVLALAAAAVAVPLVEVLVSMALAVASGAGVIIATRLCGGEKDKTRKIFQTAVWMLGARLSGRPTGYNSTNGKA